MNTYRKVLLATDFTEHARKAAVEAVRVARRHHAELHVLHVDVMAGQVPGDYADPKIPDYIRSMGQLSPGADPDLGYKISALKVLRDASEAAGILRYAREQAIDLVVVGTHGRNAVSEWVLGSVAQAVVRDAPVPVLVVGANTQPPAQKLVLVPVDFSAPTASLLACAAREAEERHARLMVLHVVDPGRLPYPEEVDPGEAADHARKALRKLVAGAGLPEGTEAIVAGGPVAEEIVRIATREAASLIVMAPSGHGRLERLMIGSVCKPVVRSAPCPVLVHREPVAAGQQQVAA